MVIHLVVAIPEISLSSFQRLIILELNDGCLLLGLAIAGLLQMIFAYRVWFEYKIQKPTKLLILFPNVWFMCWCNLFIMSFANMYDHLKLHVLTASIVFQLGIVWAILSHFALPGKNKPR